MVVGLTWTVEQQIGIKKALLRAKMTTKMEMQRAKMRANMSAKKRR